MSTTPSPRRIDHVVVAVHDLDAAAAFYERLGFQVGARNRHPWGTENRLIQLRSSFIELITVGDDAGAIPPHGVGRFSFGAFLRDALRHGEGLAMLALSSADAVADAARFAHQGIGSFEPFHFARKGRRPDGSETEVAFSLAFAAADDSPAAGFFVCQHHYPENFWSEAFQRHPNGALEIDAVTLAHPSPGSQARFLAIYTGAHPVPTSGGAIAFALDNDQRLNVERRNGTVGFVAFSVSVADRELLLRSLRSNHVAYTEDETRVLVGASEAHGIDIVFDVRRAGTRPER